MTCRRSTVPADRGLLPGKRWLTYDDVQFALGFGRTRIYELIQRGVLLSVGKGKATRVTADSVRRYAEELEAAARKERGIEEDPAARQGEESESRAKPGRR